MTSRLFNTSMFGLQGWAAAYHTRDFGTVLQLEKNLAWLPSAHTYYVTGKRMGTDIFGMVWAGVVDTD